MKLGRPKKQWLRNSVKNLTNETLLTSVYCSVSESTIESIRRVILLPVLDKANTINFSTYIGVLHLIGNKWS